MSNGRIRVYLHVVGRRHIRGEMDRGTEVQRSLNYQIFEGTLHLGTLHGVLVLQTFRVVGLSIRTWLLFTKSTSAIWKN